MFTDKKSVTRQDPIKACLFMSCKIFTSSFSRTRGSFQSSMRTYFPESSISVDEDDSMAKCMVLSR